MLHEILLLSSPDRQLNPIGDEKEFLSEYDEVIDVRHPDLNITLEEKIPENYETTPPLQRTSQRAIYGFGACRSLKPVGISKPSSFG